MVFPIVGGDGKPTGYDIENSLRLNNGDSPKFEHTFSAGNRRKFTFSTWLKRSELGDKNIISADDAGGSGGNNNFTAVYFASNDRLYIYDYTGSERIALFTTQVFQDTSAWYHLVIAFDTEQGTASNRIKVYVNGVQVTEFASSTYPSQNLDTNFNHNGQVLSMFKYPDQNNLYYDGYIAETYFVDGQQYDPTYFGKFDDNNEWIPVQPGTGAGGSITYGTNGFLLEFKQTGTSQNSSGIGADTSGEDHHFAVTNLAATDITVDTPTNNFATLNPLSAGSDMRANGSFKEGNCELVNGDTTGESNGQKCSGTMGFANGKWYWEVKLISNTMTAGIVDSSISTTSDINLGSKNAVTYDSETGAINNISGAVQGETVSSQYDDDDIIGVAVDADNGAVYFAKNNTYQNSGNPTSGASKTGGATFTLGNQMLPLAADNSSGSAGNHQYNFGNAPFSISSGNADANGYGNFEYAPPSGYYSLCTKNLAEYG